MKRLLFVLFIAVAFVSCEGPMGPQGPAGESGGRRDYMSFVIRSNEWLIPEYDGKPAIPGTSQFYYYRELSWDALDELAVEQGVVVGYVLDFTGAYTTLPHVFHDKNYNEEWTETTSLSFFKGGVEIQVTNSDFADVRPGDKSFRLVVDIKSGLR
ncbi:MAG: hypothetical protein LBK45_05890 [Tannerellaceae bacterium]|jgi:hypothetical protein|nr:hypothetical protein [Tannerellaceae bacterium]